MTTQEKELKTEIIQVKITPTMRAEIERVCAIERRDQADWLRLVIQDAIYHADDRAALLKRMQEVKMRKEMPLGA